MRLREDISEILARQGGMILTRQVTECGLSLTMLSRYAKAGLLLREKSGVYTTPDGFVDPMLLMNLRVKQGVLSHGTAVKGYDVWIRSIKEHVQRVRFKALMMANAEQILRYWDCWYNIAQRRSA